MSTFTKSILALFALSLTLFIGCSKKKDAEVKASPIVVAEDSVSKASDKASEAQDLIRALKNSTCVQEWELRPGHSEKRYGIQNPGILGGSSWDTLQNCQTSMAQAIEGNRQLVREFLAKYSAGFRFKRTNHIVDSTVYYLDAEFVKDLQESLR